MQEPSTIITIIELVQKLSGVSLATLLALILYGSYRQWWVWARERDEFRVDRDRWQALALENLGLAKKAVDHAARTESGSPIQR